MRFKTSRVFVRIWHKFLRCYRLTVARPRLLLGLKFLVLFAIFYLLAWKRLDPDFGWHLVSGNYFRAHGIPSHDIFTYTARNFPWVDHEWGNDVIVSVVYGWGGYDLLAGLYGLVWSASLIIVAGRTRLFTLLVAAAAMLPYAGIRPVAWTVLLFAIALKVLRARDHRWRWVLPVLLLVWANLHGGFIVGLAVILYYALIERNWRLLPILVLSLLATFVNPYGPGLYVEVARTLFDPTLHSQIREWTPLLFFWSTRPFIFLWGAGAILFFGLSWHKWLHLSSFLLLAAVSATRNVPLFVIAATGELDEFISSARQKLPHRMDSGRQATLIVIVAIVLVSLGYGYYASFWPWQDRQAGYPLAAVAYLKQNGCENGNIFNDYNYGGFLIWKLPKLPVYIDGRMPSWKDPSSQKYMTRYLNLLEHPKHYKAEFNRYDIRCALLVRAPARQAMIARLERDNWRVAVVTSSSVLLLAPQN